MNEQEMLRELEKLRHQAQVHFMDIQEYTFDQEQSVLGLIDGLKSKVEKEIEKEQAERDAWSDSEEARLIRAKVEQEIEDRLIKSEVK